MIAGVSNTTAQKIINLFKNHPKINTLFVFGSRASNKYKNGSDIDLAIDGKEITGHDIIDLYKQVDDLYTPYKFDIISLQCLTNKTLYQRIISNGVVLFNK